MQPKDDHSLVEGLQKGLSNDSNKINEELVKRKVNSHSYENILEKLRLIYETIGKK